MKDTKEARQWVEALRSGKYAQGHRVLRDGDAYCCLGVAVEVCGVKWKKRLGRWGVPGEDSMMFEFDLPAALSERLGMTREEQSRLVTLNDTGSSFSEIADTIESWLDA